MRTLILSLLGALIGTILSIACEGATLLIVNKTGAKMRIIELSDKCGKRVVSRDKPYFLMKGEGANFMELQPVIHTYEICGSGFCSMAAIGFDKNTSEVVLNVVLEDGIISGNAVPNIWPGNMECGK